MQRSMNMQYCYFSYTFIPVYSSNTRVRVHYQYTCIYSSIAILQYGISIPTQGTGTRVHSSTYTCTYCNTAIAILQYTIHVCIAILYSIHVFDKTNLTHKHARKHHCYRYSSTEYCASKLPIAILQCSLLEDRCCTYWVGREYCNTCTRVHSSNFVELHSLQYCTRVPGYSRYSEYRYGGWIGRTFYKTHMAILE